MSKEVNDFMLDNRLPELEVVTSETQIKEYKRGQRKTNS